MKGIRDKGKTIRKHVKWWSLYIVYEILVAGVMNGRFSSFYYYLFFYLLNVGLFYFHALYVMPASFEKQKKLARIPAFVGFLAFEITVFLMLTVLISYGLEAIHARSVPLVLDRKFFVGSFWRGVFFLLVGSGYYFLMDDIRRKRREVEKLMEIQQLRLKLVNLRHDFLRSQINPHLLFNTLNFIRHASKYRPEESEDAIQRLAEIMNFAIEKDIEGYIPLLREIRQVENVIRLNQLRFEGNLHVDFNVNLHDPNVMVVPILLLTLVENVFKHGNVRDSSDPAQILVRSNERKLSFYTSNLPKRRGRNATESPGTGLENILERLESTFPGRYDFKYGMEGGHFVVQLVISLSPPA